MEQKEKEQVFNREPALMPSFKRIVDDTEDWDLRLFEFGKDEG